VTFDIAMPRLSDSMELGTILTWLKRDGDLVSRGEELVEIETDKATMTYESPDAGTLSILAQEGTTLPVGALLATLRDGANELASRELTPTESSPPTVPAQRNGGPASSSTQGDVKATPLARRVAGLHDVDLAQIEGSGPGGRVTRADVAAKLGIGPPSRSAAVNLRERTPVARARSSQTEAPPDSGVRRTVELSRLQQAVARRTTEATTTIPHFQVQTEALMDRAVALRKDLKQTTDAVPSVNDFVVKACALALRLHPRANGSYADGGFELHARVNVGIAVAAEDALVVPTILDADTKSLGAIAVEAQRLTERVRRNTIAPPELSGGTFTVSNLGMYGMTAITPVINPPQAAILGVGAIRSALALEAGELVEHHQMTLTLSCDHRILYGADAAQFLATIRELLEHPLRLLL
jgi:pyruvate dehydrogenase E2 component (dihydrolipoamide acetyltransferase)